ncbi:UDP-glucose 4-epimerase [Hyphomicrobium sulfonivorans]|uniref:UDP-glucose 4-epimerase n=1 Tax=Hyphomicrobium sulfonivorans TaxID=121290 RepID=A0A109BB76_HYPSL|nr:NAD-dependent epimerase/dehydratase family protein [Hyphomicrobium sulfonivorans]KWT65556.1 UDP-glucose 4-epimerase [Hyphomicrobium sulfonivorans]
MKILITGGSGFIGTVLVRQLLAEGHDVIIYDKVRSPAYPELTIVNDVRNAAGLVDACRGVDAVIHLAAEHADDVQPVSLYYDVNVGGAENLARACDDAQVPHIIFTSTVAVYGLNAGIARETNAVAPFNDYGHSKWQAEQIFAEWQSADTARRLTTIRPSVVFGEGNRGNVYNLIRAIDGGRFMMVGRGTSRKSMAYVENVASFIASRLATGSGNEIFNYADTPDLTTAQLVEVVQRELGLPPSTMRIPLPLGLGAGYLLDTVAAITGRRFPISAIRIRKFNSDTQISADRAVQTGFQPRFSIADGLQRMVQHDFT